MKYKSLIMANLFRKKLRTTLTIGSFVVALFLFGLSRGRARSVQPGSGRGGRRPARRDQQNFDHSATADIRIATRFSAYLA